MPSTMDNYSASVMVNSKSMVNIGLWDTSRSLIEDYDRLRVLSYSQTDVFLVCFPLNDQVAFENVRNKWIPEIKHHAPDAAVIIVGTMLDLRNDRKPGETYISKEQGEALKVELGASKYMECSARTQEGLKQVFDEAVRRGLVAQNPDMKKSQCVIL